MREDIRPFRKKRWIKKKKKRSSYENDNDISRSDHVFLFVLLSVNKRAIAAGELERAAIKR